MLAASVTNALWAVVTIVVVVALAWLARRIDPHWVAKNGQAFTCRIQPLRSGAQGEGRWREARASIDGDHVRLSVRGIAAGIGVQRPGSHRVLARSDSPPPRSAVFLLDGNPMWALRVPKSSKAVASLEALIDGP